MKYLLQSFKKYHGLRGVHFYSARECYFMPWQEVLQFLKDLSKNGKESTEVFIEKLSESLANYDPTNEFLAVCQNGESVSVELYCHSGHYVNKTG